MILALFGLVCVGAGFWICWSSYLRGRESGFADGYEYGEREGYRHGLARGVALTNHAWESSIGEAEPLLIDLTDDTRQRN